LCECEPGWAEVKILFSSTAGVGHFRSLTPFVDACLARGHEALVAGPRRLADLANLRGYAFTEFDIPPADQEEDLRQRLPKGSVFGEIYGRLRPRASLPTLVELCNSWHPDAVIRDRAEFGSVLAAEQYQIPVVRVSRLASFEENVIRQCAKPLDELRRSLGLPADPDTERIRHSPSLTFWPLSLEDPAGGALPHTLRFRDPRWDESVSKLAHDWGDRADPLIYVTFGTVTGTLEMASQVYKTAIQAIRGLPVRALLSAGRADGEPPPVKPGSENLRVESWVNEPDVVAHCAAVVCHGGSGSILTAAAAGVPLVIAPLFGDQHANARRVCAFGAATRAELEADSIRQAILRVVHDDTYRSRAGVLAEEMRAQASCETALDLVAKLTAGSIRE
jgi:UDP:flavonoid glycosyltransferase YjiC (YdhE family)